jgi:hypothetical protein
MHTLLYGQSIPNGGFENWTSATYDYPQGYIQTSNTESFFRCNTPFNCVKTTDAYHGTYAAQLTTHISATDTCFGYFINTNANGDPLTWTGGFPYNQMATGIKGYYKSNVAAGDSAGILLLFRAAGNPVGFYLYKFTGVHNTYTPFSFTFSPPLLGTPDSVIFAAISSDVFNDFALDGSMFQIDSVSFTGVASQPAAFNGDFEQWQSQTLYTPTGWFISSGQGMGFNRTTDVYAGTYAMELQTYLGDNNGNPAAQAGQVGTGYCNGNGGPCVWQGGYPFSSQVDTLAFYYKYAPSGNDTAQVSLTFKNNGIVVWNAGMGIPGIVSTYQYAEIPFNSPNPIDTVIVQLQSSSWNDTALSFVGSNFKVDNIHFKSQITGTGNLLSNLNQTGFSYPNPVRDILNIRVEKNSYAEMRLTIYDATGRMMSQELLHPAGNIEQLDVSGLQPGIYMFELAGATGVLRNRFVKE